VTNGNPKITGAIPSTLTTIVWIQDAVLPFTSVAMYVLVVVSKQPTASVASGKKLIPCIPHASVAITVDISGAGTDDVLHASVMSGGQVINGGIVSLMVIDATAVSVHILASVTVTVYVPAGTFIKVGDVELLLQIYE